jgi:hypothetical protein
MADYDKVLVRIIRDANNDPAKMREIVYEVARLALRRQANLRTPALSYSEMRHQLAKLEEAIARVEASASADPGEAARVTNGDGSPMNCERDDAAFPLEEVRPHVPSKRAPVSSRELVLVPDRVNRSTYLVNPADFVSPDIPYRLASAPRPRAHLLLSVLRAAFQLTVASVAFAGFYVAMWGPHDAIQSGAERPPVAGQPSPALMARWASLTGGDGATAPSPVAAVPFPLPTVYGVYAINGNQLMGLQRIQGTPVDPRTRNQLQIGEPSRTVIDASKLKFVVYRRDLVSSAPDNVQLRIAARIAHSMTFDSNGRPVVTTPTTKTWLIRNDHGYDLQVSPLQESAEMVILRPQNPEFSYPSGRYELMLGEQAYDFVVAGEVTDSAHCVEGTATGRGPVFYECKSPARRDPDELYSAVLRDFKKR